MWGKFEPFHSFTKQASFQCSYMASTAEGKCYSYKVELYMRILSFKEKQGNRPEQS